MFDLQNKKVLITGATGGIGNSLVKKFLDLNATVLATGTKKEKLDQLTKQFSQIKIIDFKLDQHSNIEKFIEKCHEVLGGLDILINNAGINSDNISLRLTEQDWKKVIDLNLTSTFLMCKYSIKKMLKQKKTSQV